MRSRTQKEVRESHHAEEIAERERLRSVESRAGHVVLGTHLRNKRSAEEGNEDGIHQSRHNRRELRRLREKVEDLEDLEDKVDRLKKRLSDFEKGLFQ